MARPKSKMRSVREYLAGLPQHYRSQVLALWKNIVGQRGGKKITRAKLLVLAEQCIYPVADDLECRYAERVKTPVKQAKIIDALFDAMNRVYDDLGINEPVQEYAKPAYRTWLKAELASL